MCVLSIKAPIRKKSLETYLMMLVFRVWFGFVSLVCGISTFMGYLMPYPFFVEWLWWCYLAHSWRDKGVHTFPWGISPKVDLVAQLTYLWATLYIGEIVLKMMANFNIHLNTKSAIILQNNFIYVWERGGGEEVYERKGKERVFSCAILQIFTEL